MRSRTAPVTFALVLLVSAVPVRGAEPSVEPSPAPTSRPVPEETPAAARPDTTDRYIVVLDPGKDPAAVTQRHARARGLAPDRVFRTLGGFAGKLTKAQVEALEGDPDVAAIVPDEIIELASQLVPTGVSRVGTRLSPTARLDGVDQRVNADVAIVDTGIDGTHPDLNVVGGVNCSTSNRSLWRDVQGHGTHVAGTVGAIDNGSGVVGVAPGVRLWAVKILDDTGSGLLSWYVCGLDWIAAQRDPADPARPMVEAVNMSVAKWGKDDGNCGRNSNDILHAAICRVVATGVTVIAAAANDSGSAAARVPAAYNEVITVSALADTDGRAGGLGGTRCYSWGSYDVDDTFANFSNYGADVDIIAPGKCIWSSLPGNRYGYSSGTSMAAPAVTGAAALFLSTRKWPKPGDVKGALQALGNLNWKTSTDPDSMHEKLLDVSKLATGGDYTVALGGPRSLGETGGTVTIPVEIERTPTSFETVYLSAATPEGVPVALDRTTLTGFTASDAKLTVTVPGVKGAGRYPVTVTATQGSRVRRASVEVVVENDVPTAYAPTSAPAYKYSLAGTKVPLRVTWPAATDPSSAIAAYEVQHSMDWGAWGTTKSIAGTSLSTVFVVEANHSHRFRVRARDAAGHWSAWAHGGALRLGVLDDQSTYVRWSTGWRDEAPGGAWGGLLSRGTVNGATSTTTVTARQLGLVAEVGPTGGWLEISVNGFYQRRISLWNSTRVPARVLWLKEYPTEGSMKIELTAVTEGTRNTVNVDAILVGR